MADMREQNLVSLEDGDYEVAQGEPDVRGWDVVGADHTRIGEVDDLLVDPGALKVRYLVVDLDRGMASETADRTVRVPIERARLRPDGREVLLDMAAADLRSATPSPPASTARVESDEARMTRAAEELRIGRRQVAAGEVGVSKRVETSHVREPVTRQREEVRVERRPVTGEARGDAAIGGEREIRMPVTEEELIVEKRPVAKEEVIVSKRPVTERDTVEADLREERVDVERSGDVRIRDDERGR